MLPTLSLRIRCAVLSLCIVSLTACITPAPHRSDSPTAPTVLEPVPGAAHFAIDENSSQLIIRVYRDGPLARLGHNHVISTRGVSGSVFMANPLEKSLVTLNFAASDLVVDNAELRAAAGPEFDTVVNEKDRNGTRDNMLSAAVLDATNHPEISVRSLTVTGELPELTLGVEVTLRGITKEFSVPASVGILDDRLIARSSFTVSQSQLGMKPFSVMMGALRVKDQMDIKVELVAVRQ